MTSKQAGLKKTMEENNKTILEKISLLGSAKRTHIAENRVRHIKDRLMKTKTNGMEITTAGSSETLLYTLPHPFTVLLQ